MIRKSSFFCYFELPSCLLKILAMQGLSNLFILWFVILSFFCMKTVFGSSFLFFKRLGIDFEPTRFTLASVSDILKTSSDYSKTDNVKIRLLVLVLQKIRQSLCESYKISLVMFLFRSVYRTFAFFLILRPFCPLVCFALENVLVFLS